MRRPGGRSVAGKRENRRIRSHDFTGLPGRDGIWRTLVTPLIDLFARTTLRRPWVRFPCASAMGGELATLGRRQPGPAEAASPGRTPLRDSGTKLWPVDAGRSWSSGGADDQALRASSVRNSWYRSQVARNGSVSSSASDRAGVGTPMGPIQRTVCPPSTVSIDPVTKAARSDRR